MGAWHMKKERIKTHQERRARKKEVKEFGLHTYVCVCVVHVDPYMYMHTMLYTHGKIILKKLYCIHMRAPTERGLP